MRFTNQRPDLGKAFAETERDIERAVTSGMRDAADGLKQDLREDVVAAGLGERLSRTWRGKTFPEVGDSAEAAAYVWSRAPKIVDAFDRGVVIRSSRGLFLAIPTAAAGKSGRSAVLAGKNHAGRLATANRLEASVRLSTRTSFAAGRG